MDDRRVGRLFRAVRQRKDYRQADVAKLAGVGQTLVSDIELGRLESVGLVRVRRVAAVLDISISIDAWWRGGEADRLLDRGHASLVEPVVALLRAGGWEVVPEFTFNVYGDRGSVDVLAWHPIEHILLIVEVKTALTDLQETLSTFSKKVRVVPGIIGQERGWNVRHVAKLLVVSGTTANRSVVTRHGATFDAAFPGRSAEARAWLRRPSGPLSAVWFVSNTGTSLGKSTTRARVRRHDRRTSHGAS
jgi:transcriptional regulator with XRE-family HTH domain